MSSRPLSLRVSAAARLLGGVVGERDDGDALAVLGGEVLDVDQAGHGPGHGEDLLAVRLVRGPVLGAQAAAEHGHDLAGAEHERRVDPYGRGPGSVHGLWTTSGAPAAA